MSSLVFRITGDPASFKAAMGEVSSSMDAAARKAKQTSDAFSSMGSAMTVGLTLPVVALGVGAVKAAGDLDVLKRALVSTTGSASEATAQFARLEQIAKLPGIGLDEAVRGSIRLQAYGLSAALAEKALKNFSNAVAAGGGSADDTAEALRQLGQMYGRGKVTMDNLRIILERVPQAAAIIRKEWGSEALADPAKAFEALGLTSQQVIERLIELMGGVPAVSIGVKTALENLGQEVQKSAARIGDKLVPAVIDAIPKLEAMAGFAADLVDGFTKLPGPVQNTALAIGGLALIAGPATKVFLGISSAIAAVRTAYIGLTAVAGAGAVVGAAAGAGRAAAALGSITGGTAAIGSSIPIVQAAGAAATNTALSFGTLGVAMQNAGATSVAAGVPVAATASKLSIAFQAMGKVANVVGPAIGAVTLAYQSFGKVLEIGDKLRKTATLWEETTGIGAALSEAVKKVSDTVKSAREWFGLLATSVGQTVDKFVPLQAAMETWRTMLSSLKSVAEPGFNLILSGLDGINAGLLLVRNRSFEMDDALRKLNTSRLPGVPNVPQIGQVQVQKIPTIADIMAGAGIKNTLADYQKEIDSLRSAEKGLLELQARGVKVSGDLAIVRNKLAEAIKAMASATMGASSATNAIRVDSVAETAFQKLNRQLKENTITAGEYSRAHRELSRTIGDVKIETLNQALAKGKISSAEFSRAQAALNADLRNGQLLGDQLSKTSLVYVESLERTKAAIGRVKDVMFEYITAGTLIGKKLEVVTVRTDESGQSTLEFGVRMKALAADLQTTGPDFAARVADWQQRLADGSVSAAEFAAAMRLLRNEQQGMGTGGKFVAELETWKTALDAGLVSISEYTEALRSLSFEAQHVADMPPIKMLEPKPGKFVRGSIAETDNLMTSIGSNSAHQAQMEIARTEGVLERIKALNQEGKASGIDVQKAQQAVKKAYDDAAGAATASGKKQSKAMQQVSTVLTDLSRSIARAGINLLFDRPKTDVQKYKDEITALEAEQQKLIASQGMMSEETAKLRDEEAKLIAAQVKGHNVAAQLAVVRSKITESEKKGQEALIEVQNRLAEANRKMGEELHKAALGFRALEAGKSVIKELATAITRLLIEDALGELAKKLVHVGGLFGKVFGGGTGVIKSVVPNVVAPGLENGGLGNLPGPPSGSPSAPSGGGLGGAGSALMGWVGLGAQVVSAISGVVSNFQFAHMNTALGRIEESTRYLKIYTGEQSQSILWCAQKSTELLGYVTTGIDAIGRLNSDMLANLQQINASRMMSAGMAPAEPVAATESGVTVSMAGAYLISDNQMGEFADRLIRLLKSRGVQFA